MKNPINSEPIFSGARAVLNVSLIAFVIFPYFCVTLSILDMLFCSVLKRLLRSLIEWSVLIPLIIPVFLPLLFCLLFSWLFDWLLFLVCFGFEAGSHGLAWKIKSP